MYSFKVKRNPKTPKGVKLRAVQNGYPKTLIFFYFDPKTQTFDFLKIKVYKIQHFEVIQKTVLYVVNLDTSNTQTKFPGNIFIFGCAMIKNPGKGNDVTFLNTIFGISNCRT